MLEAFAATSTPTGGPAVVADGRELGPEADVLRRPWREAVVMPDISCPACHHTFAVTPSALPAPDPSVVQWFRSDPGWSGEVSTDEVYTGYLRATDGPPVSRQRFVSDLAYLGVEEVLDDDTHLLART